MTVNSYLTNLAGQAIIRDTEKSGIQRSITTLRARLNKHFGADIKRQLIFGSYSRNTILPRSMDERSDIDYLIVFDDVGVQPQALLNRLNRFAQKYYARSDIAQSNPTIILELNHIRFELVPASESFWSGLQIPAPASAYQNWMDTDPTGFNSALSQANQNNNKQIKPLVRLVKYWNASNGYVFDSYSLEQSIAERSYWHLSGLGLLSTPQLKDYFFGYMEDIDLGWNPPKWKNEKVLRAKRLIAEARLYDGISDQGERKIKQILPPIGALQGLLGGV